MRYSKCIAWVCLFLKNKEERNSSQLQTSHRLEIIMLMNSTFEKKKLMRRQSILLPKCVLIRIYRPWSVYFFSHQNGIKTRSRTQVRSRLRKTNPIEVQCDGVVTEGIHKYNKSLPIGIPHPYR